MNSKIVLALLVILVLSFVSANNTDATDPVIPVQPVLVEPVVMQQAPVTPNQPTVVVTSTPTPATPVSTNQNEVASRSTNTRTHFQEPSTNGNGNNGGNNDDDDDESGSRRRSVINLPVEELNTTPKDDLSNKDSKGLSVITGAVIGTLGKKGAIGFGVLLVVLGIAGLVVYNRESLGLVKAK